MQSPSPLSYSMKTPLRHLILRKYAARTSKEVDIVMSRNGEKNKRGERGSTEEDSRTAKKSNMATKEVSIHTDQDEPTLLEIKEMLVDIQISIASESTERRN